jgi:hypothetical protein
MTKDELNELSLLGPTNLNSSGLTKSTNYFNNYFDPTIQISQNINDAILSYFEQQTSNVDSAKILVQAVIETAQAQRQDPLTVLNSFQNLPSDQLSAALALYLNSSRVNTSYLGIKQQPTTNSYVTRSIVS